MKQGIFTIAANDEIGGGMMRLRLAGDASAITAPGQFADVKLDGFFLRRPISICDWDAHGLTLVYRRVGEGTRALAGMRPGTALDLLTGLGNGYRIEPGSVRPVLIGGGAGVPPMYALARALLRAGVRPTPVLGFNRASEIYYADEFRALGLDPLLATADGSAGVRGFVTDALRGIDYDYFYACGPMPMYRAIHASARSSGQYSFEARMGCGFGACVGCSIKTAKGNIRLCKDGPVLREEEVLWTDGAE